MGENERIVKINLYEFQCEDYELSQCESCFNEHLMSSK